MDLKPWKIRAENKVKEILTEVSDSLSFKTPVPIQDIIEQYVGDVNIVTRVDIDFPEGVSAFTTKDMNMGWLIVVNGRECTERQRFSMAHEFGHIVLPIKYANKVFCSTNVIGWDEKLCDQFAGDILMPENMVHALYKKNSYPLLGDIARAFKVSWAVAEIQLKKLGLPFRLNTG